MLIKTDLGTYKNGTPVNQIYGYQEIFLTNQMNRLVKAFLEHPLKDEFLYELDRKINYLVNDIYDPKNHKEHLQQTTLRKEG